MMTGLLGLVLAASVLDAFSGDEGDGEDAGHGGADEVSDHVGDARDHSLGSEAPDEIDTTRSDHPGHHAPQMRPPVATERNEPGESPDKDNSAPDDWFGSGEPRQEESYLEPEPDSGFLSGSGAEETEVDDPDTSGLDGEIADSAAKDWFSWTEDFPELAIDAPEAPVEESLDRDPLTELAPESTQPIAAAEPKGDVGAGIASDESAAIDIGYEDTPMGSADTEKGGAETAYALSVDPGQPTPSGTAVGHFEEVANPGTETTHAAERNPVEPAEIGPSGPDHDYRENHGHHDHQDLDDRARTHEQPGNDDRRNDDDERDHPDSEEDRDKDEVDKDGTDEYRGDRGHGLQDQDRQGHGEPDESGPDHGLGQSNGQANAWGIDKTDGPFAPGGPAAHTAEATHVPDGPPTDHRMNGNGKGSSGKAVK